MNKVAFMTLGCKTNQYETDALMDIFYRNRYEIVEFDEFADIYVINTCTVTNMSDKKSRQMIRRAKKSNENGLVVVLGCYAQISPEEVGAIDDVDIVIGTDSRSHVIDYIEKYREGTTERPLIVVDDIMKINVFEEMSVSSISTHTRAFIKIQEGCNQYCSYCIIPYARGKVRSRSMDHILSEVTALTEKGYSEFVLTGIHIGSYGLDLNGVALIDLLEAINQIDGVMRIRLGSIEPRLIDDAFISRIRPLNKLCDHFHLSLQSGSNTVLKRMNRKYTAEMFLSAVEKLRSVFASPSLTTDIIVGFPGETDEEFNETLDFVNQVGFSEIHVFQFSKREGTPAATMPDQVDASVKKIRSERLIDAAHRLSESYKRNFLGTQMEVIIEERKGAEAMGHTKNYLKVHLDDPTGQMKQGKCYNVILKELESEKIVAQFA